MRLIDRGKEDPATLREILLDVEADGRRAHEIIQDVRNTIKKGDPTRHRINLNELVTKVAHIVRPDAVAYSCEIETSLAEDLPLIEGDPVQIQQVLVNLVSNAIDAMRQTPPDRRKVEISTAGNGENEVRLSVRDHGTGIRMKCMNACSTSSLPPRNRDWEWDWQLCAPSWNLMAVKSRRENVTDGRRASSILLYR